MTNAKKGRVSSMRLKRFCENGRCGIEPCCRNDCKRRVEIRFGCLWIRWASMGKDSPLIFVSDRLWNRICDRWQGVEGACGEGDAGSVIERSRRQMDWHIPCALREASRNAQAHKPTSSSA